ncbi:MAG: ATP-dependent nuclease [Phyllobacterium sp.]
MLQKIRIRNFRSITDLSLDAENLNILVGRNDTGKSNILRALNLFFNNETDFRHPFDFSRDFPINAHVTQGKAPEIRIDLTLAIPGGYQAPDNARSIEWTKRWRRNEHIEDSPNFILSGNRKAEIKRRSKIHSFLKAIDYHYIPALKGKDFFSELLADIYDVLSDISEEELKKASESLQKQVEDTLIEVAAELSEMLKAPSNPKLPSNLRSVFRLIQFEAKGIDLDRRGDGIRVRHVPSLVKFLCDLKSQRAGRHKSFHVWGLEEPENSVDFVSAFELRDQISNISKLDQFQIFMATHSPIFFFLQTQDQARASFFSQKNEQTVLADGNGDISDEMGVLRVVSPYVEKSRVDLENMRNILLAVAKKMERDVVDPSQRVVFVEGESDVNVMTAVNAKLNYIKDVRFIASFGDSNSCANSVADNAIAWHHLQKNRLPALRVKAIGLVDADEAGKQAIAKFQSKMDGEPNFLSRVVGLRPTKEIAQLYRKHGFMPKISLEDLFPISLWERAKLKDWLEPKSDATIFEMCTNEAKENVLAKGLSSLEKNVLPFFFQVKISRKEDFSKLFLEEFDLNITIADSFRQTLIELRSALNQELV